MPNYLEPNVMQNTWGHLAPKKNTSYKFKILFCVSAYASGSRYLIDTLFDNELDSSPWLYEAMNDIIYEWGKEKDEGVYLVEGTFRNYRFFGNPKLIYSLPR